MACKQLKIYLQKITENWASLDALSTPSVETSVVIKANAYGLGVREVGKCLFNRGARSFFVARPEEGAMLRQALGLEAQIYLLYGHLACAITR